MQKRISYAVANFQEIIEGDYYYVDHTRFIQELEKYKTPVFLRPRRFGKSLWCSTLKCYYDILLKNKFKDLFGKLEIGKNPTGNQNTYMILSLDFSQISVYEDTNKIEKSFKTIVSTTINSFINYYQSYFKDFSIAPDLSISDMLMTLLTAIKDKGLPPLYLIIDEYDNFTNQLITNYKDNVYQEVTDKGSWLQTFFKVIKAGTQTNAVGKVFITGVLPITIDDLTSGFNIAQFITLNATMSEMLGFTSAEVDNLLTQIYDDYRLDKSTLIKVKDIIKTNYNGYKFNLNQQNLVYNSTLLNYFLFDFIDNQGKIPKFLIDENLRTDSKWIKRITLKIDNTKKLLNDLVNNNSIAYNELIIKEKFNAQDFFNKEHYPLSFFYLGLLTIKDEYEMEFPNLSMRDIFVGYFNEVERIDVVTLYAGLFKGFLKNPKFEDLFKGYWDLYISQIEAQAFDKANENFFRTTFYCLMKQFLSNYFFFAVEYQVPSGRIDYIMIGKDDTQFAKKIIIAEFKYWSKANGKKAKVLSKKEPDQEDVDQVNKYAVDLSKGIYSDYEVEKFVVYVVGNEGHREWRMKNCI